MSPYVPCPRHLNFNPFSKSEKIGGCRVVSRARGLYKDIGLVAVQAVHIRPGGTGLIAAQHICKDRGHTSSSRVSRYVKDQRRDIGLLAAKRYM